MDPQQNHPEGGGELSNYAGTEGISQDTEDEIYPQEVKQTAGAKEKKINIFPIDKVGNKMYDAYILQERQEIKTRGKSYVTPF